VRQSVGCASQGDNRCGGVLHVGDLMRDRSRKAKVGMFDERKCGR
jgi:hypothetical protein